MARVVIQSNAGLQRMNHITISPEEVIPVAVRLYTYPAVNYTRVLASHGLDSYHSLNNIRPQGHNTNRHRSSASRPRNINPTQGSSTYIKESAALSSGSVEDPVIIDRYPEEQRIKVTYRSSLPTGLPARDQSSLQSTQFQEDFTRRAKSLPSTPLILPRSASLPPIRPYSAFGPYPRQDHIISDRLAGSLLSRLNNQYPDSQDEQSHSNVHGDK